MRGIHKETLDTRRLVKRLGMIANTYFRFFNFKALMKIIKHAREAHQVIPAPAGTSNATISFSPAVGQLLGIDSNGTLEVSNVFALPPGSLGGGEGDSETRGARGGELLSLDTAENSRH
jgi:hypothetical protein